MRKKENKNKNIITILSIIILLMAITDVWPSGFFILLRWVIFGTTGYLSYLAFMNKNSVWAWLFVLITLLFNPVFPIYLTRDLWMGIDLLVAFFLTVSLFSFNPRTKR